MLERKNGKNLLQIKIEELIFQRILSELGVGHHERDGPKVFNRKLRFLFFPRTILIQGCKSSIARVTFLPPFFSPSALTSKFFRAEGSPENNFEIAGFEPRTSWSHGNSANHETSSIGPYALFMSWSVFFKILLLRKSIELRSIRSPGSYTPAQFCFDASVQWPKLKICFYDKPHSSLEIACSSKN